MDSHGDGQGSGEPSGIDHRVPWSGYLTPEEMSVLSAFGEIAFRRLAWFRLCAHSETWFTTWFTQEGRQRAIMLLGAQIRAARDGMESLRQLRDHQSLLQPQLADTTFLGWSDLFGLRLDVMLNAVEQEAWQSLQNFDDVPLLPKYKS